MCKPILVTYFSYRSSAKQNSSHLIAVPSPYFFLVGRRLRDVLDEFTAVGSAVVCPQN